MKRWHQEINIIRRQWKLHRQMHVESNKNSIGVQGRRIGKSPYEVDCACDDQIGRFRKKDAYDCGNSGCQVCHGDKFPKRDLTEQEKNSEISFREQLKELDKSEKEE